MNDLIANIEKLHTTELGAIRIKKNLCIDTDDVIEWCKETIKRADIIVGQGKNWYVYSKGVAITINAQSNTIITAHKINAKARTMKKSDYACLNEFLYQAIFIPDGEDFPPRSIINNPEIFIYIKDFGSKIGDLGVVAEQNGQIIGAAWTRIISAYGHLDDSTPELSISILPEFRGYGIGTKLMNKIFKSLKESGYSQTSLSVQKDNRAVQFYLRMGYEIVKSKVDHKGHEDYLMRKVL
jgi:ribosomal protein S18 acetylase RimI-like enzyme